MRSKLKIRPTAHTLIERAFGVCLRHRNAVAGPRLVEVGILAGPREPHETLNDPAVSKLCAHDFPIRV
jgi:hypothetical protein